MTIFTKTFQGNPLSPRATPDGTSVEERVNAFIAPIAPANVLDIKWFIGPDNRNYCCCVTYQA